MISDHTKLESSIHGVFTIGCIQYNAFDNTLSYTAQEAKIKLIVVAISHETLSSGVQ